MIKIKPSRAFKRFSSIYGSPDILARYRWFLYEWSKRVTRTYLKHLRSSLKDVRGTKEYRRRLVVAELRVKGKQSWFAVVASAKSGAGLDPRTTRLEVVARFKEPKDPAFAILEQMGPWTVDTLPFLPSSRQGQVISKTVAEKDVEAIRESNFANSSQLTSKMVTFGLAFEDREKVHRDLKIVRDIELQALAIEFGMAKQSKAHWRPSLRWIKKNAVRWGAKDKDLVRVWFDPNFKKYRLIKRLKIKLSTKDLGLIREFQNRLK